MGPISCSSCKVTSRTHPRQLQVHFLSLQNRLSVLNFKQVESYTMCSFFKSGFRVKAKNERTITRSLNLGIQAFLKFNFQYS